MKTQTADKRDKNSRIFKNFRTSNTKDNLPLQLQGNRKEAFSRG